ncbi:hypothetical protein Enr13x_02680 [Stieleria neptunia]|uniref:Uncharacterized protein n=1 Tax=Stieleria neptunia TaxID=2527979 RepID=A0A518HI10_9BACT|nr:hypothetical protein Enr13x_02680 [Stieleria neptunia]
MLLRMNARVVLLAVLLAVSTCPVSAGEDGTAVAGLSVVDFLPKGYVRVGPNRVVRVIWPQCPVAEGTLCERRSAGGFEAVASLFLLPRIV